VIGDVSDLRRQRICYNSCRDRHCPKCQSLARAQWLEDRRSGLLDTQYFHVVFIVPQPIAAIALQNKETVYNILFRATAMDRRGARPTPAMSGDLQFFSSLEPLRARNAFLRHIAPTRKKDWVVYAKPPFAGHRIRTILPSWSLAAARRCCIRIFIAWFRVAAFPRTACDGFRVAQISSCPSPFWRVCFVDCFSIISSRPSMVVTVIATLDMTTKCRSSAQLDRAHDATLCGA
jgi:Transposase zinc-binding domain